ncbi:MAG: UDP-2,3-diacylglucosamine diphosphatase LpxI [Alphaproteobacteria bacterium]|nr:UDP-2,3-diacylglucosamine diphosphatase LpxI [Alphaproteobacteria bacterium]
MKTNLTHKDSEINYNPERKLGIVAGGGNLPKQLIDWCKEHHRPYFALAIQGNADKEYFTKEIAHEWVRIGQAGTGFKHLKEENVKEIVLIGTIKRPTLAELVPDVRTAAFFARLGVKSLGDDGILRALVKEIESEGMKVVGIQEVLPDLLVKEGILTKKKPDNEDEEDIRRGVEAATMLGRLDIGQSVVVQQGLVLGMEGIEGTDKLILRCADYKRKGKAPILVKLRKPQQDLRLDLPTIGINTIENAHQSGLKGLAVHAGNTLIVDEPEVIKLANKYGIFIKGIVPMEYSQC